MAMPLAKLDLLLGYGIAFATVAAAQATLVSLVAFGLLDLHSHGPTLARRGARGLERDPRDGAWPLSQRVRADRVPGGAVHARGRPAPDPAVRADRAPRPDGEAARDRLGVLAARRRTAYDALQRVSDDLLDARLAFDVAIVVAATLLALALGAATLRRQTP